MPVCEKLTIEPNIDVEDPVCGESVHHLDAAAGVAGGRRHDARFVRPYRIASQLLWHPVGSPSEFAAATSRPAPLMRRRTWNKEKSETEDQVDGKQLDAFEPVGPAVRRHLPRD